MSYDENRISSLIDGGINEQNLLFNANKLKEALYNPLWLNHRIGDAYTMDNKPEKWKIAYYPIFENGKTREVYNEPRALVERPIGKYGTDMREVPLRYLTK